jgi:hypothetical protein
VITLYRVYDAADRLLYVGITGNLRRPPARAAEPNVPCHNFLPEVMAQTPWPWHMTPCPGN